MNDEQIIFFFTVANLRAIFYSGCVRLGWEKLLKDDFSIYSECECTLEEIVSAKLIKGSTYPRLLGAVASPSPLGSHSIAGDVVSLVERVQIQQHMDNQNPKMLSAQL